MARVSIRQSNSFRVTSGFITPQSGVDEGLCENNNTIWGQNTYSWEHIYLLNYNNKNNITVKSVNPARINLASTQITRTKAPQQTLVRI